MSELTHDSSAAIVQAEAGHSTLMDQAEDGSLLSSTSPRYEAKKVCPGCKILTILETAQTTSKSKANLYDIPNEILSKITDPMSPVTLTCFGLSCTKFYIIAKPKLLYRPSLLESCCHHGYYSGECSYIHCKWRECILAILIGEWMGPRYRLGHKLQFRLMFLNTEFYGERPQVMDEEDYLSQRYKDYDRAGELDIVLPSPFGLGSEWYGEAKKAMIEQLKRYSVRTRKYVWRDYQRLRVFTDNEDYIVKELDDCMWEMWSQGIALMGF